jgi:lipoprotein-anchoring transpeptidase ErfK/SrfK
MSRRLMIGTAIGAIVLILLGGTAVWAATYDRNTADRLLSGTTIGGVVVGGMRPEAAVQTLRERLETPLRRELQLIAGDLQLTTTPWDLGYRIDVRAPVRKAMGEGGGTLVTRVWKRLFSQPQRYVEAKPRWVKGEMDNVLARLAEQVKVEPKDAQIDGSTGWLRLTPPQRGQELDVEASREALRLGAELSGETVYLVTRDVEPQVGRDAFDEAILIRTGENRLYLYRNGAIAKSWPVATGAPGFPTPTGTWRVVDKYLNPDWINPGSAWAAGMPARIPPGPNNPLGTHALALDAPGILIHATPDTGSIGYNVSHGCVRMLPADEVELFEQVDVETPVLIVNAGTPRPRDTSTPTTGDPVSNAAALF